MNHIMSRPLLPTALLLALAAFLALAALAGAEKVTTPAGNRTPENFAFGCLGVGGDLIEVTDDKGNVLESSCWVDGSETGSCDWVQKTCIDVLRETRNGGLGQVPTDGVLDGSQPTQSGPAAPGSGTILDGGR